MLINLEPCPSSVKPQGYIHRKKLLTISVKMHRWSGRVALVTGASAGIGAATCEMLVKHGMKVVGCARNVTKIQVGPISL